MRIHLGSGGKKVGRIIAAIFFFNIIGSIVLQGIGTLVFTIIAYNKNGDIVPYMIVTGIFEIIIPLGIGVLIGYLLFKSDKGKNTNAKDIIRIKEKGEVVRANVVNVAEDKAVGAYNTNGYSRLFCTYEDVATNKVYRFVSEKFVSADSIYVREGMLVDVYVNPRDEHDYYVALESIGITPVLE